MMFLLKFESITRNPMTMVEITISAVTIVGALYLLSPFLVLPTAVVEGPPLAQAISNGLPLITLGVLAFLASAWDLWAIYKKNLRQRANALFLMFVLRLYSLLAVILIIGFFPMSWLASATVLIIIGICYVNNKFLWVKQKNDA